MQGWITYPALGGSPGSLPGTVCIASGNGPWGSTAANSGSYFTGLQSTGASISQTVGGLTPGQPYVLLVWLTSRNGYAASTVIASINGQVLLTDQLSAGPFTLYPVSFTPSGTQASIVILNSSPSGDRTVFVNNLQVAQQARGDSDALAV